MKIIVRKNGRLINTLQESCVFSTWNKECTEWQATSISLSHSVAKSEENIWSFKTGHDMTSSVFFYTEMNRCSNEKCIFFLMAEQIFPPILSVCAFFLDCSLVGMASSTPPTTSYLVTRNKNVACYSLRPMLRFHKWKKPPESLSDKKGERESFSFNPPTLPQNTTNFVDPLYRGRTNHLCCSSTNKMY